MVCFATLHLLTEVAFLFFLSQIVLNLKLNQMLEPTGRNGLKSLYTPKLCTLVSTCNQHNTYSGKLFRDVLVPALNHTQKKSLIPQWFLQLFIYFLGCGCVKAVCGCYSYQYGSLLSLHASLLFSSSWWWCQREMLGWRSWRFHLRNFTYPSW